MRRRLILSASIALAAILVTGCRLPSGALDGPLAVPLRIVATPDAIDVDAPAWFAPESIVYLCSTEPPDLPEPGPDREGWTPGPLCHDYGRVAAPDGLTASLPVAALTDAERPAFEAAPDWHLLIVKVDGTRAVASIRSTFPAPDRP
jgi:hypothetical protein